MRPDDKERREKVLRERAQRIARAEAPGERRELLFQAAVLLVGEERLGIPVTALREVLRSPRVTPLPGLPEWLLGICHVRGEIMSVVDLARWMGVRGSGLRGCLAVVEDPRGPVGLLADDNLGFREVYADDLVTDLGRSTGAHSPVASRTTKDLCAILDVGALLADPRLIVGGSASSGDGARVDRSAIGSNGGAP